MKDELNALFSERFSGHESPVDPGAWQAIQAKLGTASGTGDEFQELFQERFAGHEAAVPPSSWANISNQLGHGAAATGSSGFMGAWSWAAVGVGVVAVVGAVYLYTTHPTAVEPAKVEHVSTPLPQAAVPESEPKHMEATPEAAEPASTEVAVRDIPVPRPEAQRSTAARPERGESLAPTPGSTGPIAPEVIAPTEPIAPEKMVAATDGPAIVEGIISKLTEEVKADVQSGAKPEVKPQAKPNEGRIDEQLNGQAEPETLPLAELPELFLPNTFTPNGDGVNDTYEVPGDGFSRMIIRVYSVQDNKLVFSTDNNEPWTGANCAEGYYLLAVEAITEDGRLVTQGRVVWLNRSPMN